MDKVGKVKSKILFLLVIFILALAFSAAIPRSEADTVFLRPRPAEKLGPGEHYPESRFGQPPAPVDTGVGPAYAAHAVEDMEAPDEADTGAGGTYSAIDPSASADGGASRAPAGLQYVSGKKQEGHTYRQSARSGSDTPESSNVASGQQSVDTQPALSPSAGPRIQDPLGRASNPITEAARHGVQEVALIASDLGYFPKTLFVSRDVPVRLFVTGASKNTLCIMMDSFSVRKQVRSQKIEEITFTPMVPGKYRFYCPVNGMQGTLVVKDLVDASYARADSQGDSLASGASAPSRAEARQPASLMPASAADVRFSDPGGPSLGGSDDDSGSE